MRGGVNIVAIWANTMMIAKHIARIFSLKGHVTVIFRFRHIQDTRVTTDPSPT